MNELFENSDSDVVIPLSFINPNYIGFADEFGLKIPDHGEKIMTDAIELNFEKNYDAANFLSENPIARNRNENFNIFDKKDEKFWNGVLMAEHTKSKYNLDIKTDLLIANENFNNIKFDCLDNNFDDSWKMNAVNNKMFLPQKSEKMAKNYCIQRKHSSLASAYQNSYKTSSQRNIDLEAIEVLLKARIQSRKNDKEEEIAKRLSSTSNVDGEEYFYDEPPKPLKKPSLESRLRNGMNLEVCFVNSNCEDVGSNEYSYGSKCPASLPSFSRCVTDNSLTSESDKNMYTSLTNEVYAPSRSKSGGKNNNRWNRSFDKSALKISVSNNKAETDMQMLDGPIDLQSEAQMALAQAQMEARILMDVERYRNSASPITTMIRNSLKKIGMDLGQGKRRVSRQFLTNLSVAQLQAISDDLQSYIQRLNESLVKMLMERDESHMKQDSLLVDIEDIKGYLNAKRNSLDDGRLHNNGKVIYLQ